MRRTVSTNLGHVSREVNTSRGLLRMQPILPYIQNDHIQINSNRQILGPLFSHVKHVTRPHFRMSLLKWSVDSYYNVPRDWLKNNRPIQRKKTKKKTKNESKRLKQKSYVLSLSSEIRASKTATWYLSKCPFGTKKFLGFSRNKPQIISFVWSIFSYL